MMLHDLPQAKRGVENGTNEGGKVPEFNTWLFLEESFIKYSPSRKQLTLEQELKTRESLHDFIIKLGSALKMDGKTILSATVFVNRFYMRMPITTSKYYVASAAIAISCKLNDNYRPPDKIAMTACILKNPNKRIDEQSDVFWGWRDQLLYREELILKNLNFDLNIDLPYELRDGLVNELCPKDNSDESTTKTTEILKNTVSLIELLSSLPILVAYDINTLFGAMLVVVLAEAKERFGEDDVKLINISNKSVNLYLNVDPKLCYKCYQYILKLLKYCDSKDPKLSSHRNASRKVRTIDQETFFRLANT